MAITTIPPRLYHEHVNAAAPHTGRGEVLIAANDAPDRVKAFADYNCDGTADEVQINAAIDALPAGSANILTSQPQSANWGTVTTSMSGGRLVRPVGTFTLADVIDLTGHHNVVLDLSNAILINGNTSGGHAIKVDHSGSPSEYTDYLTILGGIIQGNSAGGDGIHLHNTGYTRIAGTKCIRNAGYGLWLSGNAGCLDAMEDKVISGCHFLFNGAGGETPSGGGVYAGNIHETLWTGCHFEENYNANVHIYNAVDQYFVNCSVEDSPYGYTSWGILAERCHHFGLNGGTIEGNISIDNGSGATIPYVIFEGVGGGGYLDIDASNADVTINGCRYMHPRQIKVNSLGINGSQLSMVDISAGVPGYIEVYTEAAITGNRIQGNNNSDKTYYIRAGANSARVVYTGNTSLGQKKLIFDGNGKSHFRCTYSGNNGRSSLVHFKDIEALTLVGNVDNAGGGYALEGSGKCTVNSNTLYSWCNITIGSEWWGQCRLNTLHGNSNIVNNSVNVQT